MGDFITNLGNTVFPDRSGGATPSNGYVGATELNAAKQALLDLRAGLLAETARAQAGEAASVNPAAPAVNSAALVQATGSSTARTLAARFADVVNAADFGADPAASAAINTAAVQAALTAGAGRTVLVPDGNYSATSSVLTIPVGTRVVFGVGTFTHAGIRCADSPTSAVEGCNIQGGGPGRTVLRLASGVNVDSVSNATSFDRLRRKEISGAVRSGNVSTVTTSTNHNFQVGDVVSVENTGAVGQPFSGFWTVASTPTSTTFTFAQTGANESATVNGYVANAYGAMRFQMSDLTIDGNRTGNLTSGSGVSIHGRAPKIRNVEIYETRGKGLWMEGSTVANFNTGNELEPFVSHVNIHGANDLGLLYKGPHDGFFEFINVYSTVGGAEFWRAFRFNNMNFFLCGGTYGLKLTAQGAANGSVLQSEAVIVDASHGGAPAPNTVDGATIYGIASLPALEVQGYDNHWTGWIKNDANTQGAIKLNGGGGVFDFLVGQVNGYWVDYGAALRTPIRLTLLGNSIAPGLGYETGSTMAADETWMYNVGAMRVRRTNSVLSTFTATDTIISQNHVQAFNGVYAALNQSSRVDVGNAGPGGQSGVSFQTREVFLYRDAASVLRASGALVADGGVVPGQLNAGGYASSSHMFSGSGVPSNTYGANGDFYLRSDTPGTANQRLYVRSAGAWVGIL